MTGLRAEPGDGAAGYTLVELLVVTAILAAVAALAIPSIMRPSERLALTATVRELTGAFRLTRSAAISRNTELVLMIDADRRIYRSAAIGDRMYPASIQLQMIAAETERVSPTRAGVRFYPDGSSSGAELTLSHGGKRANLCIHWLTGLAVESEKC